MSKFALLIATLFAGVRMPESHDCPVPPPAAATETIRVLNQQYIDAARISNGNWFGQHMAEDIVVVLGDGHASGRRSFSPRSRASHAITSHSRCAM